MDLPHQPLSDGVLTVAPSAPADTAGICAAVPPGEPGAWEATPGPYTLDQARRILHEWEEGRRQGARASLTVRGADDGRFVGAVVLIAGTPEKPEDAAARGALEVAYWVAPGARGAGAGACAVRLVAGWARRTPGVDLLWAGIDPANEASRRVALAAGFAEGERLERAARTVVVFSLSTAS